MLTNHALLEFSTVVARVSQQPQLLAVSQILCTTKVWTDALLLEQLEALLGQPVKQSNSEAIARALRMLRRSCIAALAELDLCQGVSLEVITGNISCLADFALKTLLTSTGFELAQRYGTPVDEAGKAIDIQVIAMGKHGANELNVSSDIDIILLARDLQGETSGVEVQGLKRTCSNREFLSNWAKQCISLMNAQTADGFIFRVDTRLRPHGSSGPIVVEHQMLEQYLVTQGRMWERLAWLKARGVMTPVFETQAEHAYHHQAWQKIVQPFVYRRYLDYTVIESLRELHALIRAERRAYEAKAHNGLHIKLARGGIRELEFWVQGQQLIRAGRDPSLRINATLPALQALAVAGVIEHSVANQMALDYRLFRRIEHALQYIADAQTHSMPADETQRGAFAHALGYESLEHFDTYLMQRMNVIAEAFDVLFTQQAKLNNTVADRTMNEVEVERLQPWVERIEQLPISDATRLNIHAVFKKIAHLEGEIFESVAQFIVSISKRRTYIDILLHHPPVLLQLVQLMQASPFAAKYLHDHPALLDELIDANALFAPMDETFWQEERNRLFGRLKDLDEETQLHVLREVHHACVLRVLAQDLRGDIDVRAVSDALSYAADMVLDAALCCVHAKQFSKFETPKGLAVIAYGKLGGKELGYGSDLDIVFLFDATIAADAVTQYPRMIQRLISWLTMQTAAGRLFEIDTALRPNGQAGMMLTSVEGFEEYQVGTGPGPHAWLWEHQAISRARQCAGDFAIESAFNQIRNHVLSIDREVAACRKEVVTMREKVRQGHVIPKNMFDAKHSLGGMVDIEFAVQYIVLQYASKYPELRLNIGNVALLLHAATVGIVDMELAHQVGQAYMKLRTTQHQCRLKGQERAYIELNSEQANALVHNAQYVQQLWHSLGLSE